MGSSVALLRVMDVVRRDQRNPQVPGGFDQHGVDPTLLGQAVVLELEEETVRAEDVPVGGDGVAGSPSLAGQEQPRRLRRQAAGQADQSGRSFGQQLLVDPGPVPEAFQVGVGDEPEEVPVALFVPDQDR